MVQSSVRRPAGRTWWPYSSIPRRAARQASGFTRISCRGPGLRTVVGDPASRGVLLRGSRVRLRPLEREDLPRYQGLFSEPEISLHYGGVGGPRKPAPVPPRLDGGGGVQTEQ